MASRDLQVGPGTGRPAGNFPPIRRYIRAVPVRGLLRAVPTARAKIANQTFEPAIDVWHRRGNAGTDSIRGSAGVAVISRNNISAGAIVITPEIPTKRPPSGALQCASGSR